MPRATRLKKNNRGPATVVCPWCQNPNKLFWPGKSINSHIARCPAYKEVLAQNNIPEDAEEEGTGSKDPGEELELEDGEQGSVDENMEGGHLGVEEFGNVNVGRIGEHADDASMDILDPNTIEEPDAPINPLRKTNTRTSRLPSRYRDFSLATGYSFLADPIHHQPTPSPEPMEDMQEVESGSPKASQESNPMEQDHPNENDYFISQPNEFGIYRIHRYHRPSREPEYGIDDLADSRNFDVAPSFSRSPEAIYGKVTPEGDPSSSFSSHSPSHVIGSSHEGDTDSLQESQDLERYPSVEVPSDGESHISENEVAVGPFQNSTIFRLMDWALNVCRVAKGAGAKIIDRLVHEVILAPEFNREHLLGFRFRQQEQIMDAYRSGIPDIELPPPEEDASEDEVSQHPSQASTESATPLLPFVASDEWHTGHVDIPVPCARYKCKEDDAKIFRVNDIYYRNPLDVIQCEFADTTFYSLHLKPFKEFFRPSPNADVERVYGEVYTSDRMLEMERDVMKRVPNDNEHEVVIAALMDASDSTLLANFGTASLWPGYSVLGNLSHYIRLKPSMHALNAILFVPSLPDSFQDFYKEHFERLAPDSVLRHCKRELIMLVWGLLFLNPDFIAAYLYGILMHCADDVIRLIFPRLFTHTADYVEKVILASIKFLAECPCPLCLVKKSQISQLGTKTDMRRHENKPREDNAFQRDRVEMSRTLMYEKGYSVDNQTVNELLSKWSGLPHRNPFSKLLSMIDDNYYKLFCNDLMHEAAGRWNDAFKHLCRCLYALAKELIQRLNERYRQVPTFGNGTIRRFKNNVSELKKFAFRDFEDLLQCAMPCFEDLFPKSLDSIVLDLLFDFATWWSYAHLRVHTDSTLASFEKVTGYLGKSLRTFAKATRDLKTTELPSEARKRRRAQMEKSGNSNGKDDGGLRPKGFNLSTFKMHALGHHVSNTRYYGVPSGHDSKPFEREHVRYKSFYPNTNKNRFVAQIARQGRNQRMLQRFNLRQKYSTAKKSKKRTYTVPDFEPLPRDDPEKRYQVGHSERSFLRLNHWLYSYGQDPAIESFETKLQRHLLERLLTLAQFESLTDRDLSRLIIVNDRIFTHKRMRFNHTSYDMRKIQDSVNIRRHPDVMILASEESAREQGHPYLYGRVIGIFHLRVRNLTSFSTDHKPTKMHVLWVRWYEYQQDYEWGWEKKRLPQLRFVPSSDPNAFGFVDPESVIRGAHLIPAFSVGVTDELLPEDSIARVYESFQDTDYVIEERDWNYYNVNIFVDRDMFMRYRGGGIGHSTRDATRFMEEDARHGDKPLPKYNSDTGELLSDDEEMGDDGSEGDGNEDDADEIVSQSSVESHRSVHAEPEDYDDTDPESDDAD